MFIISAFHIKTRHPTHHKTVKCHLNAGIQLWIWKLGGTRGASEPLINFQGAPKTIPNPQYPQRGICCCFCLICYVFFLCVFFFPVLSLPVYFGFLFFVSIIGFSVFFYGAFCFFFDFGVDIIAGQRTIAPPPSFSSQRSLDIYATGSA